jgi:hypothetical protein
MPSRRALIVGGVAAAAGVGAGAFVASGTRRFADLAAARQAVGALVQRPVRATGAWSLPQVLVHLAQSVEYSLEGFPQSRSALFQATAGAAAFALFDARGQMHHGLHEPIPGAPALPAEASLPDAVARLLAAFDRFEAHAGALQPHFAYGALDKAAYTRAHLMHLGDHWSELDAA